MRLTSLRGKIINVYSFNINRIIARVKEKQGSGWLGGLFARGRDPAERFKGQVQDEEYGDEQNEKE